MKLYIFLLLLFTATIYGQDKCQLTVDTKTNKPMLIGVTKTVDFQDSNFYQWFNGGYTNYKPDSATVEFLKENLKGKNILIVMGTWCSDSRREVPRVIKILDEAKFPESELKIITVDRKRKAPGFDPDSLNIEYVPTIIVYENGKELGRIIESPVETLETDLKNILSKKGKN